MNVIHSDKDGVELADVSESILWTADPLKMWHSLYTKLQYTVTN
jgi:hypothetical protein